ncbi:MAG: protein-glutamate O-methyltransferase CheR [Vicinamibacteria bacterium]|nr:protein-glutamate O-methyltransferase CheR [Vicinamibacteria bacterium]
MTAAAGDVRPLTSSEFARFQRLVLEESGIHLSDVKRALLVGRLARRLRELELDGYGAYLALVERDGRERVRMLDCLCTNETHFFREPRQFEFLRDRVFPVWAADAEAGRRPRRVRAWSAACSTGEEPFSVAMTLLAAFPPGSGWELQILATDLSTQALDRARSALWNVDKSHEIPAALLRRFMLRGVGSQQGRMKAGPELRALVRFERLNLNGERYGVPGDFDLVFCRNVLIYFRPEDKARVVVRLLGHLAPGGHLLLGHAESLTGLTNAARTVGPNVYVRGHDQAPATEAIGPAQ